MNRHSVFFRFAGVYLVVALTGILVFGTLAAVLYNRTEYAQERLLLEVKAATVADIADRLSSGESTLAEAGAQLRAMTRVEGIVVVLVPDALRGAIERTRLSRREDAGTGAATVEPLRGLFDEARSLAPYTGRPAELRKLVTAAFLLRVLDGDPADMVSRRTPAGSRVVVAGIPAEGGAVFLHRDPDTAAALRSAQFRASFLTLVLAFLFITLVTMVLLFVALRRTTRPLTEAARIADGIAAGDLGRRMAEPAADDETATIARAVNRMVDRLSQLEKVRSEFIANVSHELRTPLTIIRANLQGVREGVVGPDESPEFLEAALRETRRMEGLVNELIDLSLLETSDFPLEIRETDLTALMRDAAASVRPACREKGQTLTADIPDGLTGEVDGPRITQVLLNLLGNAVKFTPDGGSIRFTATADRSRLVAAVRDTGPGIPVADLPQLFQRYRKSGANSGSGLGLALGRAIARAHGGDLEAFSDGRSFTELRLTLPL